MNVALVASGIIGVLIAFLVVVVGITAVVFSVDDREMRGPLGVGAVILVIAGLVLIPLMFKVIIAGQRGYGTDACESFADQTGYTTRYITTTYWDGGECFVDSNGSWVPKDQLWLEVGRA